MLPEDTSNPGWRNRRERAWGCHAYRLVGNATPHPAAAGLDPFGSLSRV